MRKNATFGLSARKPDDDDPGGNRERPGRPDGPLVEGCHRFQQRAACTREGRPKKALDHENETKGHDEVIHCFGLAVMPPSGLVK